MTSQGCACLSWQIYLSSFFTKFSFLKAALCHRTLNLVSVFFWIDTKSIHFGDRVFKHKVFDFPLLLDWDHFFFTFSFSSDPLIRETHNRSFRCIKKIIKHLLARATWTNLFLRIVPVVTSVFSFVLNCCYSVLFIYLF